MRRRALAHAFLLVGASLTGGCAIDTELGLDATIRDSQVTVLADGSVGASLELTYRVGPHAEGTRTFQPQAIEVYADDALVGSLAPNRPPGFVDQVAPGDSVMTTLTGETTGATDPTRLCSANVRVLLRWVDGATMEIGMTDAAAGSVTCE